MTPSGIFRAIDQTTKLVVQVLVGGILLFAGIGGAFYQIEHPPVIKPALYAFLGLGVLGALLLPSIFPIVQQIVVFVFPNGIPWPGGRRASDPPAPPKP